MELTAELAHGVAEYLENTGEFECEVREDYSGRGMYGATCVALVTDAPAVCMAAAVVAVAVLHLVENEEWALEEATQEAYNAVPRRQDNMGRSKWVYY